MKNTSCKPTGLSMGIFDCSVPVKLCQGTEGTHKGCSCGIASASPLWSWGCPHPINPKAPNDIQASWRLGGAKSGHCNLSPEGSPKNHGKSGGFAVYETEYHLTNSSHLTRPMFFCNRRAAAEGHRHNSTKNMR